MKRRELSIRPNVQQETKNNLQTSKPQQAGTLNLAFQENVNPKLKWPEPVTNAVHYTERCSVL
jgi:hypothetical protein